MQTSTQKLRISQSNIEIDDILSDLQQPEQPQSKKDQPPNEGQKQVAKPQTALAAKRAAHKETKEQTGLKVQGAKIAGVSASNGSAPKNKENTDAINKKEQSSFGGSE